MLQSRKADPVRLRRRRVRLRSIPSTWAVLVLAFLIAARYFGQQEEPRDAVFRSPGPFRVTRVVDGDTLVLAGGHRIRLIGVDTPETKHPNKPVEPLGPEASQFTQRHVEGRNVTLKFDRERIDRYHRILAYVYVGDWFLNEELILAGFSRAETRYPFDANIKRRFRNAEQTAREQRRGIWAIAASKAAVAE